MLHGSRIGPFNTTKKNTDVQYKGSFDFILKSLKSKHGSPHPWNRHTRLLGTSKEERLCVAKKNKVEQEKPYAWAAASA